MEQILLTKSRQLVVACEYNNSSKIIFIDLTRPLPTHLDLEKSILVSGRLLNMQEIKERLFLTTSNEVTVLNLLDFSR